MLPGVSNDPQKNSTAETETAHQAAEKAHDAMYSGNL